MMTIDFSTFSSWKYDDVPFLRLDSYDSCRVSGDQDSSSPPPPPPRLKSAGALRSGIQEVWGHLGSEAPPNWWFSEEADDFFIFLSNGMGYGMGYPIFRQLTMFDGKSKQKIYHLPSLANIFQSSTSNSGCISDLFRANLASPWRSRYGRWDRWGMDAESEPIKFRWLEDGFVWK